MDSFIIIIILYIVLYTILSLINAINQRKKKELLKEKREEELFEEEERTTLPPPLEKIKIEEKSESLSEELKEPEKIEIYETKPKETKKQEDIIPEKEKLIIEEKTYYHKIPKIKKILSFSKNEILKGIIYKEILTTKFKNKL